MDKNTHTQKKKKKKKKNYKKLKFICQLKTKDGHSAYYLMKV